MGEIRKGAVKMETRMTGKIIVVGNNIDTDQIYPGCYLAISDPKEIGTHCLSGVDEKIAENFPEGGIVVAGKNFGCGSSREHAPIALLNMGARAVIADSFARIFFRNSINLGLVLVTCPGISQKVKDGQTLTLDIEKGLITVEETKESYPCDKLGDQAMKILEAGGIKPLMRKRFGK
ncbi:3-isopropylmalate dehydratase small subunit [Brotaphodocola sp.]|uniref:LeuD/DmdB family oxidoreductase small subunit n=1 Tax=Brotaphodocola sp. TaxID=3073577 RepID=UPI003D7D9366